MALASHPHQVVLGEALEEVPVDDWRRPPEPRVPQPAHLDPRLQEMLIATLPRWASTSGASTTAMPAMTCRRRWRKAVLGEEPERVLHRIAVFSGQLGQVGGEAFAGEEEGGRGVPAVAARRRGEAPAPSRA